MRQRWNFLLPAFLILAAAANAQVPPIAKGLTAPTFSKVFAPDTIGPGSVSMLTFTIDNTGGGPVEELAFTDVLPSGVTLAAPAFVSNTCAGTVSAPNFGSAMTLSGGQVGDGQICTIVVNVTAATPGEGPYTNTTGDLTSTAGNSGTASADLTVDDGLPGFYKSFAPSTVALGGRSTLTLTIDNSSNGSVVPNLDFTDVLPPGMVIANPSNKSTTCGDALIPPTLTANPGTTSIILDADGTASFPAVGDEDTCTVVVDVIGGAVGSLGNVSGNLLADFVEAGKAAAVLTVTGFESLLTLEKDFVGPAAPGGTTTLQFTVTNRSRGDAATGITFSDDLEATLTGLTAAVPGTPDPPCGAGSSLGFSLGVLTLTGGSLAPEASCTFSVVVTVPAGATPGTYPNSAGPVSGDVGGEPETGNVAGDLLFVVPFPVLTKEFTDDPVGAGGTATLEFTIVNSAASAATDIEFFDELTDNSGGLGSGSIGNGFLPFPVSVGLPPVPDPPCGAGSSLVLDSFDTDRQRLSLTGGSLAASDGMPGGPDTCMFTVTVDIPDGFASGTYTNTTEEITATVSAATLTGPPASDDIVIVGAPQLSKEFTDDPVAPGGTVTLEFTLQNLDPDNPASAIAFSDDLGATLAGLTWTSVLFNDCGGTVSGVGTDMFGYSGGTLAADDGVPDMGPDECTIRVELTLPGSPPGGTFGNTTSEPTAMVAGVAATSAAAEDDLVVAGLQFTKEFVGDPVIAGGMVTLRFTFQNLGTSAADDASGIFFIDDLSAILPGTPDVTSTGPGPSLDTCGGTDNSLATFLLYFGGAVGFGSTCTIEYDLLVPAGVADDDYPNVTSSLTATIDGGAVVLPPARDDLEIQSNLVALSKEFTDDPVNPGDTVTLKFTLENLSATETITDIAFDDDLDAALSGLEATGATMNTCGGMATSLFPTGLFEYGFGTLAPGASCMIELTVSVPAGPLPGSVFPNTTTAVAGKVGALDVTGDPASDDLEVDTVTFSKSFDGPTTATGTAVLTFTLTNLDSVNAVAGLAFSDNLGAVISGLEASLPPTPNPPCGAGSALTGTSFLAFTGGSLAAAGSPGDSCSFAVTVTVPASASAGSFPNATSALFKDGIEVAERATALLVVEPPPTFAKTFAPNPILAGATSTLTFTIDNSASTLAASSLDFTDNLPAGSVVAPVPNASTTCTGGTLTAVAATGVITYTGGTVGAEASCTVQVDVTASPDGIYINTSGDLTSSSGPSGTASDSLIVGPAVDLAVMKDDGVTTATPGESVAYTIVVTNNGPSADPSVLLTDTFPAFLSCTYTSVAAGGATGNTATGSSDLAETLSMPAGSSVTYTVTCAIGAGATGTLSNTATAAPSVLELAPGNNSATDADTVLVPAADLSVTKTDSQDPALGGGDLTYTVTVTNDGGPSDATNVEVTETLPAGVTLGFTTGCGNDPVGVPICELGTIAPNASKQFTVNVLVAAESGTITNTVSVTSDAAETDPGDNEASEDTVVDADPPTVTLVDSQPDTGDGELADCEEARVAISKLRVTFSEPMQDPPGDTGVDDVTNPDNYLLVASGPDNDLSSIFACIGADPGDVGVPITGVAYDGGTLTATLSLGAPLGDSLYRLLVCGSLSVADVAGNALDGNGDGTGGDDFARTYRVELDNLLDNGHFDCTIDGWTPVSTVPGEIEHSPEDVDGSSVSGSAGFTNLSESQSFSLGQCSRALPGSDCAFEGRLRVDAAPGVLLTAASTCEFFPLPGCAGASSGLDVSVTVLGDTGGVFEPLALSSQVPGTAASALCSVDLWTAAGADFEAYLDDAGLTCLGAIFADGFESGDTSAWSATVP